MPEKLPEQLDFFLKQKNQASSGTDKSGSEPDKPEVKRKRIFSDEDLKKIFNQEVSEENMPQAQTTPEAEKSIDSQPRLKRKRRWPDDYDGNLGEIREEK